MWKRCTLVMIAGLGLVLGCGGGPKRLYYEATRIQHTSLDQVPRQNLERSVRAIVSKRSVRVRYGKTTYRLLKLNRVARLKSTTLWAIHTIAKPRFLGAEVDLIVWMKARKRQLISVKVALDGAMKVDVGTMRYVQSKALGPKLKFVNVDRRWSDREKRSVTEAFSLLSPTEKAFIKTLSFERHSRSQDRAKSALYVQKNCSAHIRVFDSAFEADRWQFVGSAQQPRKASVRIVLHEIGHAIEKHDSLQAYCRYQRAYTALNARIARFNRAQKKSSQSAEARTTQAMEYRAIDTEKKRMEKDVARIEKYSERGPVLDQYLAV